MPIYDTAGGQYSAITGRKRRFPYDTFIESQIPSLYQSRQRQEDRDYAEAQIGLDTLAIEESARASNAALTESARASNAALTESERASNAALNERIRSSGIQAGLNREEIAAQEKQAKTGALISGAQTAGLGYYGGSKLGLFGGSTATAATPSATTAGKAIIDSTGAVTGYTGTGSGVTAGGGGTGALGIGSGIAAGVVADELLARNIAGTKNDPVAAWKNNVRGITRYGGATPGQTALIEKGLGKENLDKVFDVVDPLGVTEKLEGTVARATASTLPKFLGGTGKITGNKTVDKVLNPATLFDGTWLCTKTKEVVGMTDEEWSIIGNFRTYAKGNYDNGLAWYIRIGPELIKGINGNAKFYEELKRNFLKPVIGLTRGGYHEIAFSVYKSVVIELAEKWNPGLLETLPEEYRG